MAITVQELGRTLTSAGVKHQIIDDSSILSIFEWDDHSINLGLTLMEDGEYLEVGTVALHKVGRRPSDEVLLMLHDQNYRFKATRLSWNDEGTVKVDACLSIEDNPTVGEKQIMGIMAAVCERAARILDELRGSPVASASASSSVSHSEPETIVPEAQPPEASSGSNPAMLIGAVGVVLIGVAAIIAALAFLLT